MPMIYWILRVILPELEEMIGWGEASCKALEEAISDPHEDLQEWLSELWNLKTDAVWGTFWTLPILPSSTKVWLGLHLSKMFTEPLIGYKFPTDRVKMRQVRNYTEERTTEYNETVEIMHCSRLNGSNGSNSSNSTQEKCQRVNTTEVRTRSINVSLVVWFESPSLSQYRCIASSNWQFGTAATHSMHVIHVSGAGNIQQV